MKDVSTSQFMWSPQWEFEYDSKTNSTEATEESRCCPSKCTVALEHCWLILKANRRGSLGTQRAARAVTQRLLKLPFTWKHPQTTAAFQERPSLPASLCSSAGVWHRVWVCECERVISHWRGQPAAGAGHCSGRTPAPLPVPRRSPGHARLSVCQTEESPSVTRLSSFLLGQWKASLTALLIGSAPRVSRLPLINRLWLNTSVDMSANDRAHTAACNRTLKTILHVFCLFVCETKA